MKTKTEELLYHLLWMSELLTRPTWRNVVRSFEEWVYENGLQQQIHRLEKRRLLESRGLRLDQRLVRLTEEGRIHALGGRDPEEQWRRPWDGQWRMVVFDVPEEERKFRNRLRRSLTEYGFGNLQKSVWLTPDDLTPLRKNVLGHDDQVKTFLCMEGRPCGGESDETLVRCAWDFHAINQRYREHLVILDQFPDSKRPKKQAKNFDYARELLEWGRRERQAWLNAVKQDPLLPQPLHPRGYLGPKAWKSRVRAFRAAGKAVKNNAFRV